LDEQMPAAVVGKEAAQLPLSAELGLPQHGEIAVVLRRREADRRLGLAALDDGHGGSFHRARRRVPESRQLLGAQKERMSAPLWHVRASADTADAERGSPRRRELAERPKEL